MTNRDHAVPGTHAADPEQGRRRVLVLSLSDLSMDARIQRQLRFLTPDYDVIACATGRSVPVPSVEFRELGRDVRRSVIRAVESTFRAALRLAGCYDLAYRLDGRLRRWSEQLRAAGPVDVIIVNDLWAVPLALSLGTNTPVIFDSHEHWTSESASWTPWQRLSMRGAHDRIVDRWVPRTAGMMTVSPGIASEYEERLGIRPVLVTNAPFYQVWTPSPVSEPIRLLHIGYADERRRLEDTVEAVASLGSRFTLDLVLLRDNTAYRQRLERLVSGKAGIRVLPPVPTDEMIGFANRYDIGVFLLPATFPNQIHVLPNKLFDYIQARLAVAIGPSPEMAAIVREWDCGVVSDRFTPASFAAELDSLTVADVERLKANSHRAAAVLTAEKNRAALLELVGKATNHRPDGSPSHA